MAKVARWEALRSFPAHPALGLSVVIDGVAQRHPGGTIAQGSVVECPDPLQDRRLGFVLRLLPAIAKRAKVAPQSEPESIEAI